MRFIKQLWVQNEEQQKIALFGIAIHYKVNDKSHVMFANQENHSWWTLVMSIAAIACKKKPQEEIGKGNSRSISLTGISLNEHSYPVAMRKYRASWIRPETYINQYIDESGFQLLQDALHFPEHTSGPFCGLRGIRLHFRSTLEIQFHLVDSFWSRLWLSYSGISSLASS